MDAETPTPPWPIADLGLRFAAGVVDLLVLGVVGTGFALGPLWLGGLALPMVGAVAAVLVCQVLPLQAFGATLGFRLFGLELVHRDGRGADMSELLFRELVGRGLLGAAFFSTMVVGGAGMLTGVLDIFSATRLGLLAMLGLGVVALGLASHIVILGSRDRRGLHDMMGGTYVVPRGSVAKAIDDPDLDDEARTVLGEGKGPKWPKIVFAQVVIATLAVGVPYALSRPSPDDGAYEARAKMKRARGRFTADPADVRAASDYVYWMRQAGEDAEDVDEVWQRHLAAAQGQLDHKEAAIKKGLADNPKDWDRTASLVRLLEDQDRITEARAVFEAYANAEDTPSARASLGIWLYERGFNEDAITILRDAESEGAKSAELYAYLGWALESQGDAKAALEALRHALELSPELDQVRVDVDRLADLVD